MAIRTSAACLGLALALVWPARGLALSLLLDFEDGLLPSAQGWVQTGGAVALEPCNIASICGTTVLQMAGSDSWFWHLDVTGLISLSVDWTLRADVRILSGTGINDVGIGRAGLGNGGLTGTTAAEEDGQWHELRLEMDQGANEVRSFIDGVLVATLTPVDTAQAGVPAANAIWFGFRNIDETKSAQFDNVTFTPEPSTGLLLATGLGGLALRRSRRAQRS